MTAYRKASLPLDFIVIGGSTAGLACAYSLQVAGHNVRVLEKADGAYTNVAGGVRSPPNMTRILNRWGLQPYLDVVAHKSRGISFKLTGTGETIGTSLFHDAIMRSLGADYMFIKFSDLHAALKDMALSAGAVIQYNSTVVSVDPQNASVRLEGGEVLRGDIIIAADGFRSFVRPLVADCIPGKSFTANLLCESNTSIPAEKALRNESLRRLLANPEFSIWMGDGHTVWGHPVGGGSYAMGVVWPTALDIFSDHYKDEVSVEAIDFNVAELHSSVQELLSLVEPLRPTLYVPYKPLENLVHESGKVILVGHAAHPLPPNGTQNHAIVIEDAAVLGNLFSHLTSQEEISALVAAFEEIRLPRSADVVKSEIGKIEAVAIPLGPNQAARADGVSTALSIPLTSWDDDIQDNLRAEWEELIRMFDYDADEVAEDWWVKWGCILQRAEAVDCSTEEAIITVTQERSG